MLNLGSNIDEIEIIRDFDGWSWHTSIADIENLKVNLIYQTIKYLTGSVFIQDWIEYDQYHNTIKALEKELIENYGKQIGQRLYILICQVSILIYIEKNSNERDTIISELRKLSKELEKMENKKEYLQGLANKKKEIGKAIREIDKRLNNTILLKEEFVKRNKIVPENQKIFSLSDFSESEQKEREELVEELKLYSKIMEPLNYIETKSNIKEKIKIFGELILNEKKDEEIDKHIILLQKAFLEAIEIKLTKAETKKEIEDLIYKIRYYKFIPLTESKQIQDIKELEQNIKEIEKLLITKACKLKVLNILSNNIDTNYQMVSNILETKIIDLNEVEVELKKKSNETIINIYDENIVAVTKKYYDIEDLNFKYNKKIRLFS